MCPRSTEGTRMRLLLPFFCNRTSVNRVGYGSQSIRYIFAALVVLISVALIKPQSARAAGEDNPTGVTGVFNSTVYTGCLYTAYTGNATRSITDIVVNGTVGSYRLAFTRTMNTRGSSNTPTFG